MNAGHRVVLHIVLVPEELAVARVVDRVTHGGHQVPEGKVRARFGQLWALLVMGTAGAARGGTPSHSPMVNSASLTPSTTW